MSDIAQLMSQLEAGSTDLGRCLSTRPDLSHADQLKLVLADQKYRIQRAEPCDAEHYTQILSWLADDPTAIQQIIVQEFHLRLGSIPSADLLKEFASRYSHLGQPLIDLLHAEVNQRTQDFGLELESLATQKLSTRQLNPNDLTGSYISNQTVGDLRNGRYRFARKLGQGAYGAVYLAQDTDLKRQVAVKVPSREALEKLVDIDSYLIEAQNVAALDHPHIVTVYDVGRTVDGSIYVVSKFIDGCSLAEWIKKDTLDFQAIAKLSEQIAEALHHAHQRRLIHRDIKPANILVEEATGTPYVADFGLAIREEDYLQDGRIAGTPSYMSPEQVRGEGHRLDGRSDLFSLGVVMYLMLTGRLPFPGQTFAEIAHEITSLEPPTLRSLKSDIPAELERICLKLLRKRASERYANGRELAEDLRAWLTPRTTRAVNASTQRITPRGLRSFTADDAGFFLDLLPGPRNRDGLPESIAFWKERIEQRDPKQTFTVGLLYGPSGCGKSSLVKAGLIPSLSPEVIAIYIEATPEETEPRLLRGLRKAIPELPEYLGLVDALKQLRRGEFKKVIFIIDQFEQWLYANSNYADAELTKALRQCDGEHVQSIVMIRDDFAMAAARFMDALDVPILQGSNFATVDLFDIDHARKVLIKFGQAFDRCSSEEKERTDQQNRFLDEVVSGLARDGKVVSVQIALFAEMVKDKPWVVATLEEVGGTEGIGVSFLEETFSARSANPKHKVHQQAARQLLSELLPEVGSDIKGHMRSHDALLQESIYKDRPGDFNELLGILDGQLRLITPTDPEGETSQHSSQNSSLATRYYQLTHDYLVPSLREWLTRKQRETKKGRAELKLAERAAAWGVNQERKQLPTLVEWFQIRRLTEPAKWKAGEKSVMQQASRHHLQRIAVTIAAVVLLASGGWFAWREASREQEATRIAGLVDTLTNAEPAQIPEIVKQLNANPQVAQVAGEYLSPRLATEAKTPDEQRARLHARLASVARDPSLVEPLVEELVTGKVNYVLPIRQLLKPSAAKLSESLQSLLQDDKADPQRRFRAALALADYVPTSDEATWTESHRAFVAQQLVSSNAEFQPILREALRPIQDKLLSDLERIFGDSAASEAQRLSAANALADYAANDLGRLTQWLTLATPEQHAVLYPLVSAVPSPETIAQLSEVAATPPPEDLGSVPRIAYGQRRANAAVTMLKLGEKEKVLPVFDWTDDPEAMTQFIFRCKPRGIRVETLLDSLDKVANAPVGKYPKDTRYALILSIGEYSPDEIPATRRDTLVNQLSNWYAHDPSSGVHGAAGWLLRHLGAKEIVAKIDQTPVPFSPKREWFNLAITVTPTAAENINSSVVAQQPAKRSLNSDEEPLILSSGDNPVDKTQLPLPGEKNSWLAVDSSLVTQIQSAEGFITDNFGLCQSLPLVLFIRLSEDLRPSGYRPIRIRPYLKTNDVEGKLSEVLVAAIWTRDGGEWLVQMDLSAEEIREQNELLSQKGMIVLDVAGYPSESPKGPTDKYIGIWASSKGSKSDLLVGVSDVEHDAAWKAMKQRGFSVRTRQCFRGVNGQIMHAQVWCSPADQQWEFWVGDRAFYESKLSSQTVLADVCVFDRRTTDPMSKQQPEQRYAFVFNSSARGVVAKECHDLTPSQHLTVCRSLESEGFRPISLSVSLIGGDYKCASIWHRSIPPRTFYYTFIVFPAGSYEIGSVADQPDRQKNEMRHSVTLTRPFALLDREITFEELIAFSPFYAGIMKQLDAQPKDAGFGADWYDSVAYSRWLGNAMGLPESDQCYADPETLDKEKYTRDSQVTWAPRNWPLGLDKRGFRLPTESEWEVLARSGSRTAYGFGSEVALLDRFGWFADNSGKHVHPGRELRPSLRGLFDLHGNLFEWTHDCYGDFGESTQTDPLGAQSGSLRVLRGGGWNGAAANCRAAFRYSTGPTFRMSFNGFRLALSSPFGVSRPAEQGQGPGAEPAGVGTEGASAEQRPEMP